MKTIKVLVEKIEGGGFVTIASDQDGPLGTGQSSDRKSAIEQAVAESYLVLGIDRVLTPNQLQVKVNNLR